MLFSFFKVPPELSSKLPKNRELLCLCVSKILKKFSGLFYEWEISSLLFGLLFIGQDLPQEKYEMQSKHLQQVFPVLQSIPFFKSQFYLLGQTFQLYFSFFCWVNSLFAFPFRVEFKNLFDGLLLGTFYELFRMRYHQYGVEGIFNAICNTSPLDFTLDDYYQLQTCVMLGVKGRNVFRLDSQQKRAKKEESQPKAVNNPGSADSNAFGALAKIPETP
jgi:hypothetical protein